MVKIMSTTQYMWKIPTNTLYPNKDACFIKEYIAESAISPGDVVGLVSGSSTNIERSDSNAPTGAAVIGVAGDNISTNGDTDVAFDTDYAAGDSVPVVVFGPIAALTRTGAITSGLRAGISTDAGEAINSTTMAQIFGKCMLGATAVTKSDASAIYRAIVFVGLW